MCFLFALRTYLYICISRFLWTWISWIYKYVNTQYVQYLPSGQIGSPLKVSVDYFLSEINKHKYVNGRERVGNIFKQRNLSCACTYTVITFMCCERYINSIILSTHTPSHVTLRLHKKMINKRIHYERANEHIIISAQWACFSFFHVVAILINLPLELGNSSR